MTLIRQNKIIIALVISLVLISGTYILSQKYFESEFQIFYSLDKRQNDQQVIKVIDNAHTYIYFAVYTFTKENIADALIAAKDRGVIVSGITDHDQAEDPSEKAVLDKLASAGINVETQKHLDGIMHIKAVVTDNAYALGSYNWTDAATVANDEILEVGTNNDLRKQYLAIIQKVISVNAGTTTSDTASALPVSIDYTDAANYIGQNAIVSGMPVKIDTAKSGTVFFDYCVDYKNCPFSVVIFADDAKQFANIDQYEGKNISVTGLLKSYDGHAEIDVTDPSQIKE